MARAVKYRIKFRSEVLEDIGMEAIEYSVDGDKEKSVERDMWDPEDVELFVMMKAFPHFTGDWESTPTPDDPDWEAEIVLYDD